MKKSFVIAGIISFILFIILLFSYKKDFIFHFDQWMKDAFYGNDVIAFFHYFGEIKWIFAVCVVIIILLFINRHNRKSILIVFAVGGGYFINQIAKRLIKRPRPEIPDQFSTFSFPSGHAMLGLLYIFTLCYLITANMTNRKIRYFVWTLGTIFIFFIGLSRVAESRHYASDVFAGWFLGFVWFVLCVFLFEKIKTN